MSLDKKLREIIAAHAMQIANHIQGIKPSLVGCGEDASVAAIKQAFADEGWHPPVTDEAILGIIDKFNSAPSRDSMMTGQEWGKQALEKGWRKPFHSTITKEQVEAFINNPAKEIDGFNGKYWVGVGGEVVSTAWGKLHLKSPQHYHDGYARVSLSGNKTALVHRLVAQAWLPNPDNKADVNHKNGDKGNNHVTNLEWNTRKENVAHAFRTGLIIRTSATQPAAKLSDKKVEEILTRLQNGETGTALAKEFGVAHGRIYDIKNGRSWKHVVVEAAKRAAGLK